MVYKVVASLIKSLTRDVYEVCCTNSATLKKWLWDLNFIMMWPERVRERAWCKKITFLYFCSFFKAFESVVRSKKQQSTTTNIFESSCFPHTL